jgi:hypothetical protein
MVLESVPDLGVGLVVESGFEASPHFEEGDGVCDSWHNIMAPRMMVRLNSDTVS